MFTELLLVLTLPTLLGMEIGEVVGYGDHLQWGFSVWFGFREQIFFLIIIVLEIFLSWGEEGKKEKNLVFLN